jgi:hypothetical protein
LRIDYIIQEKEEEGRGVKEKIYIAGAAIGAVYRLYRCFFSLPKGKARKITFICCVESIS